MKNTLSNAKKFLSKSIESAFDDDKELAKMIADTMFHYADQVTLPKMTSDEIAEWKDVFHPEIDAAIFEDFQKSLLTFQKQNK